MEDLTGKILADRFRVLRMLGKGGMGQVYEVELIDFPKRLAIKVLTAELASDRDSLLRFRREAELIAKLKHPNLVEILDWYSLPDGMHFYVMEVLEGEDLAQRIEREGPLSIPELASLAKQCFSGLLEAHRMGAVHRDLKPANIFLSEDATGFRARIIDFGLARAQDMAAITNYTSPMLIGTPAYMSPEQLRGLGPADESADAWGMAVLLYEAATGELPFKGSYPLLLSLIGKQRPIPLRVHRPDAPAAFADAIAAALSPKPGRRLRSTRELADKILGALDLSKPAVRKTRAGYLSASPSVMAKLAAKPLRRARASSSNVETRNEGIRPIRPASTTHHIGAPSRIRPILVGSSVLFSLALLLWVSTMSGEKTSVAETRSAKAMVAAPSTESALLLTDLQKVGFPQIDKTHFALKFQDDILAKIQGCHAPSAKSDRDIRLIYGVSIPGRLSLGAVKGFNAEVDDCISEQAKKLDFKADVVAGNGESLDEYFLLTLTAVGETYAQEDVVLTASAN